MFLPLYIPLHGQKYRCEPAALEMPLGVAGCDNPPRFLWGFKGAWHRGSLPHPEGWTCSIPGLDPVPMGRTRSHPTGWIPSLQPGRGRSSFADGSKELFVENVTDEGKLKEFSLFSLERGRAMGRM